MKDRADQFEIIESDIRRVKVEMKEDFCLFVSTRVNLFLSFFFFFFYLALLLQVSHHS